MLFAYLYRVDYFNNYSSNILFDRYTRELDLSPRRANKITYCISDKFSWYGPKGPLIKWTIAPVYISLQDLGWFIELLSEKWWQRMVRSIIDRETGIARNRKERKNYVFLIEYFFLISQDMSNDRRMILLKGICNLWNTILIKYYIVSIIELFCCKIITYSQSQKSLLQIKST